MLVTRLALTSSALNILTAGSLLPGDSDPGDGLCSTPYVTPCSHDWGRHEGALALDSASRSDLTPSMLNWPYVDAVV